MIIASRFVWLHLPKTGGTSAANLFRSLGISGISIDSDETDEKHDSLDIRKEIQGDRKVFISSRRLASWLVSDWHHKTVIMGLSLPFEHVRNGLFYSLRLGGIWVAADYWLNYFGVDHSWDVIRQEFMDEDANRLIHPLLPENTSSLRFPIKNANSYSRHLGDFFSDQDLRRIYATNPLWRDWETEIYGGRSRLDWPERWRSLRRVL